MIIRGRSHNQNFIFAVVVCAGIYLYLNHHSVEKLDTMDHVSLEKNKLLPRNAFRLAVKTFQQPVCLEKKNFVYIKMIKCASSTLANVLRRFGLIRNLTFVLPAKNRIYVGWPYLIDDTMYRPLKTGNFNILTEHAVYNEDIMKKIMPPDVVFFTSIREPFSEVKSMLNYYNVFNISGIKAKDPLAEYLSNMEKYEDVYKSPQAARTRYCIPNGFSMTKNLMSYNLGFPTGYLSNTRDMSNDSDFVAAWIKRLDSEFRIILMTEYFDESMVLLRRSMCWKLMDIIYAKSNQLTYRYRQRTDQRFVNIYKEWSKVDYVLYDHFNKSFWRRLYVEKEEFWKEVEHFRKVNKDVNMFCEAHNDSDSMSLTIPETIWNEEVTILAASFCRLLNVDLLKDLQEQYESCSPQLPEYVPSKVTC